MKIRDGYVLNESDGAAVVIYVGEDENGLNGMIRLNPLGAFLWGKLAVGCTKEELILAVTGRYDVEEAVAARDIEGFLDSLRAENIMDE